MINIKYWTCTDKIVSPYRYAYTRRRREKKILGQNIEWNLKDEKKNVYKMFVCLMIVAAAFF